MNKNVQITAWGGLFGLIVQHSSICTNQNVHARLANRRLRRVLTQYNLLSTKFCRGTNSHICPIVFAYASTWYLDFYNSNFSHINVTSDHIFFSLEGTSIQSRAGDRRPPVRTQQTYSPIYIYFTSNIYFACNFHVNFSNSLGQKILS